jgi:hypothetical protein
MLVKFVNLCMQQGYRLCQKKEQDQRSVSHTPCFNAKVVTVCTTHNIESNRLLCDVFTTFYFKLSLQPHCEIMRLQVPIQVEILRV